MCGLKLRDGQACHWRIDEDGVKGANEIQAIRGGEGGGVGDVWGRGQVSQAGAEGGPFDGVHVTTITIAAAAAAAAGKHNTIAAQRQPATRAQNITAAACYQNVGARVMAAPQQQFHGEPLPRITLAAAGQQSRRRSCSINRICTTATASDRRACDVDWYRN